MSTSHGLPSGRQGSATPSNLPNGGCQYLLSNIELRGHRCGCAGFTLNHDLPGAICACGHGTCFHKRRTADMEELAERTQMFEDNMKRLSYLEEQRDRDRKEFELEINKLYQQAWQLWQGQADQNNRNEMRFKGYDERLTQSDTSIRHQTNRILELNDALIEIEERLDDEKDERAIGRRPSVASPEPNTSPSTPTVRHTPENTWTVHVSLLPTASRAFPFEQGTNAYKRCLSRGLHQWIDVPGLDSAAFVNAVSKAFAPLLQGRDWVPLQARLCDASLLLKLGLPMLRPLDPALIGSANYDADFLRERCAVLDANGEIDSLYIAMQSETFSWAFLKQSPRHVEGLEEAWAYDPVLDGDGASAGDIVLPPTGNMKRAASESCDDGSPPKIARGGAALRVRDMVL